MINKGWEVETADSDEIADMVTDNKAVYDLKNLLVFDCKKDSSTLHQYHLPKEKKNSATKNTNNAFVPLEQRDYTLMSDNEASKLPDHLQLMRKKAIELFERNKDFLTTEQWEIIAELHDGRNWKIGLYGPSASGKTTFITMAAGALKLPYGIIVGSKGIEESKLFGKYILKDGETKFIDGTVTELLRHGGLFLFDEINMVDSAILSSMNSILDNSRHIVLDSGEIVSNHDKFRYAEAMNIGYAGTNEMNMSHDSRVQDWCKLAEYDLDKEAEIIVSETGIGKLTARKMIKVKNEINSIIYEEGDETTQRVDLRSCIAWAIKTLVIGDPIRASLGTMMTRLAKEDDTVKNSEKAESFLNADSICAQCMQTITSAFKNKIVKDEKKIEWELD